MKRRPSTPRAADAPPEVFEEGHLWLLERIDGEPIRFQLLASGVVRFGDRDRVYDDPDTLPDRYRHAVRHVRERLDREALRGAVEDVEDVVLFGRATVRRTTEYDWERTPAVLGTDVWSASAGRFYPPDVAAEIFDRLGLEPVNAIERERRARDFDPETYAVPDSAWYDGPAAGVVVRNKRAGRAALFHPAFEGAAEPESVAPSAAELAAEYATVDRLERIAADLADGGRPVTFEGVADRLLEEIHREEGRRLDGPVDAGGVRSAAAETIRSVLEDVGS